MKWKTVIVLHLLGLIFLKETVTIRKPCNSFH